MLTYPLASAFSDFFTAYGVYIISGVLGAAILFYLALRIWLNITRPVGIKDVPTPTVDQMNMSALDAMAGKTVEEADAALREHHNEQAPDDLVKAIPPEERRDRPSAANPSSAPAEAPRKS